MHQIVQKRNTLAEKEYILGRKEKTHQGTLTIGRYYALDGSLGAEVQIDALHPHIILICGKRGYGKSYTIGVFLEELARLDDAIRNNLSVVVLDTLGIYWTMLYPTKEQFDGQGYAINLFVPKKSLADYEVKHIHVRRFALAVSEITADQWCYLFHLTPTDPVGILITRIVLTLSSSVPHFTLEDIMTCIQNDERSDGSIKTAAENCFMVAQTWGIFEKKGASLTDLLERGRISIIDISCLPNQELKNIVAGLLGMKIFEARIQERKRHEQKKMGITSEERGIPLVWLAIDEAQVFIPQNKETMSKNIFIHEWMRQGRQPGLSLIMATQRPCALEPEVLCHSDLILCHRVTAQEDIDALSHIRPSYLHDDIQESLKKVGDEKGVAFLIDDTSEVSHIIKIRPRLSWHGGAEPLANEE